MPPRNSLCDLFGPRGSVFGAFGAFGAGVGHVGRVGRVADQAQVERLSSLLSADAIGFDLVGASRCNLKDHI